MFNPSTTPFQPGQIDQTMAMLSSLKDQGKLQQYVMQHQCNPNLVALASQVNSMSQQAPQPGPQGTVKDQAIQQMGNPAQPGQPTQPANPEDQLRQDIDESIANKDFEMAKKLINRLKDIDKMEPMEPMVPGGGALPGDNPNMPMGASPTILPEDQGIGTLPAQNLQGMGHAKGGIIGYDGGGSTYKPLTDDEISAVLNPKDEKGQSSLITPNQLQTQQEQMVGTKNTQVDTDYAPFTQRMAQKQAKLDANSGNNLGNALLTAGLGMMAGTSPYAMANIGQGGLKGLETYTAAQKADQQAQDALDNANLSLMQAKRAEKSGNYRDAAILMDTAQKQNDAKISHGLAAVQLKSTSQYQNQEIAARMKQLEIEKQRNEAQASNDKATTEANKEWHKIYGAYLADKGGGQNSQEQKEVDALFTKQTAKSIANRDALIQQGFPSNVSKINALSAEINQAADNIYGSRPHLQHPGYQTIYDPNAAQSQPGPNFWSNEVPGTLQPMQTQKPPPVVPKKLIPGANGLPTAQEAGAPGWSIKPLP